nr:hypothetical protein [Burkholderiales bacterium]
MPAFALDIDFYNPKAHKAHNLPRDLDEATPVLFPEGLVPDPSCIIDTGNGVHVYWFFKRAIELVSNAVRASVQKAFKAFQQAFIDRANAVGWQLDLTATVQRVWRLPGFLNRKTNKLVKVLYLDADTRYEPAELGVGEINADQQSTSVAVSTVNTANTPPTHKPDLDVVIAALKTIKSNNRYYDAIQKALAGESMAERGSRDEVLQGVCSTIAWLPEGRQADPIELAEVLRESLQQWANEEDATKTVDEEIAKAADKIERSQTDWHEQQQEKRPELDALARALGGKTGNGVPNAFFERHAIIQKRNA